MKYMVLMYSDPAQTKTMSAADREAVRHRHEGLHADEAGAMLTGAGLAYPEETQPSGWAVNEPHLVALAHAGATFVNGQLVERPGETVAA
jgi:hypothetical protein